MVSEDPCKNLPQPSNSWETAPTPHYPGAGKAFTDGIDDPAIKTELMLLRGEKTVNKALRQALELQAVLLTTKPPSKKKQRQDILGEPITPNRAKRPKMICVLELWGARPLKINVI
jgi:hypothetical protein